MRSGSRNEKTALRTIPHPADVKLSLNHTNYVKNQHHPVHVMGEDGGFAFQKMVAGPSPPPEAHRVYVSPRGKVWESYPKLNQSEVDPTRWRVGL